MAGSEKKSSEIDGQKTEREKEAGKEGVSEQKKGGGEAGDEERRFPNDCPGLGPMKEKGQREEDEAEKEGRAEEGSGSGVDPGSGGPGGEKGDEGEDQLRKGEREIAQDPETAVSVFEKSCHRGFQRAGEKG
jgi:hypothetical protein